MCTPVKELLAILENREGEATEEINDEDTMNFEDYAELRKTLIQQDVFDKNIHLKEILY